MLCLWLLTFLNISFCLASIQFNCTAGESKKVVYQCTVDQGTILGWKIVNETGTCEGKVYTGGYPVNNLTQVPCAPDFTTTLLSNTTPLISTISFTLNTNLTGYIIQCYDVSGNTANCTILVPPTAPTSFNCTNISIDSLTLQWGEPTDNGGEEELQYNITGTPGDIRIVKRGNNVTTENLLPNTTYNFTIIAGNSVGFGPESSLECTTYGNRPPMFDDVMVCVDISDTSPNTKAKLIVTYPPCPLVTDQFTPAVTSYRVVVGGSGIPVVDVPVNDTGSCYFSATFSTENMSATFTIDVYANNSLGSSTTSYRNGAVFNALWLRDVSVTNVTSSSAVIQYTTADCVLSTDLIVELITPNYSMVDGDTTHDYQNETISSFSFTSLTPIDDVVTFTLQVTVDSTIVYVTSGSLTVLPTQTTPASPPANNNALIGGVVGGILALVLIIVLTVIVCIIYCVRRRRRQGRPICSEFDLFQRFATLVNPRH